ncbi:hypothetical protein PMLGA01_070027000, partial [Plasmodium malariae]
FYIMKDFQKRGLGIVIKKYYGKMGKIKNAKTIKRQSYDDKAIMTKRLRQRDYDNAITTKRLRQNDKVQNYIPRYTNFAVNLYKSTCAC